jgi:hypothetical protein
MYLIQTEHPKGFLSFAICAQEKSSLFFDFKKSSLKTG